MVTYFDNRAKKRLSVLLEISCWWQCWYRSCKRWFTSRKAASWLSEKPRTWTITSSPYFPMTSWRQKSLLLSKQVVFFPRNEALWTTGLRTYERASGGRSANQFATTPEWSLVSLYFNIWRSSFSGLCYMQRHRHAARWSQSTPILVVFFSETSPRSILFKH